MAERIVPWAAVCVGDVIRGADGLSYVVAKIERVRPYLDVDIVSPVDVFYTTTIRPEAAVTIVERGEVGRVVDQFAERGIIAEVIEVSAESATGGRDR